MADAVYRIFGSEMSPYSVKVCSYFRFKGIPHRWIPRNAGNDEAYKRFARLPIVPTVATTADEGLQDSTPIIEALEAEHPQPGIQLYECSVDPTCRAGLRARGPAVLDWCHRMLEPRQDGPFEDWASLAPTLAPLLAYVGRYFLPWSEANARALAAGEPEFAVRLEGRTYVQQPQKYHAKSLVAQKAKAAAARRPSLDAILEDAGCLGVLAG